MSTCILTQIPLPNKRLLFFLFFPPFTSCYFTQISLMPRHSSLEMFNAGDPASNSRKQNYERYRCHEGAKSVSRSLMSSTCSQLISSMSAVINDGALREFLPLYPAAGLVTCKLTHGLSVDESDISFVKKHIPH